MRKGLERGGVAPLFWVALGIGSLYLLGHQLISGLAPIVFEEHNWRQGDVFSVAESFHRDGFDFFHPRIDFWRGPTGIVGMEAPVFPAFAHFFMYIFGSHPRAARLAGLFVYYLALGLSAYLLQPSGRSRRDRITRFVAFIAVAAFSPMALVEFRQVQPDGFGTALALLAAALSAYHARTQHTGAFAAALGALSLSLLTKSPNVVAGPALFLLSWLSFAPDQKHTLGGVIRRGLAFLIPLAIAIAWFAWAKELTNQYERLEPYFNLSFSTKEVVENLKDPERRRHVLGFLIADYGMNPFLVPLLVAGLFVSLGRSERRMALPMGIWLLLATSFLLCFAFRTTVHWYYGTIVIPPLLYFGSIGLSNSVEAPRTPRSWFGFFIVVLGAATCTLHPAPSWASEGGAFLLLGIVLVSGILTVALLRLVSTEERMARFRPWLSIVALLAIISCFARAKDAALEIFQSRTKPEQWFSFDDEQRPLREAVDRATTRSDLILVNGYNPYHLHLARRRGFSVDEESLDLHGGLACYLEAGVRYYLRLTAHADVRAVSNFVGAAVAAGPGFALHRIEEAPAMKCDRGLLAIALAPVWTELEPGDYTLQSEVSPKCLARKPDDAVVGQYPCGLRGADEQFRLESLGKFLRLSRIEPDGTTLCLWSLSGSPQGTLPRFVPCSEGEGFDFEFRRSHEAFYILRKGSRLVLDMPPTDVEGESLQLYAQNGGPGQRWRLARVSESKVPK